MRFFLFLALLFVIEGSRLRRQGEEVVRWENIGSSGRASPVNDDEDLENEGINSRILPDVNNGPNEEVPKIIPSLREPCSSKKRACVLFTRCKFGKIISDGFGVLTTRSGAKLKQHSDCPLYLDVCCERPDLDNTAQDVGRVEHNPEETVTETQCGQRNYNGVGATIGRLTANFSQFAEFPWMAAILREEFVGKKFKLYLCGGSLISPNVILTAAHCIASQKAASIIVRIGEWDTRQTYEPWQHQERRASILIHHPEFNPDSLAFDFSLIVLEEPFAYAPHIAPICLPNANDDFTGQVCYATGWGKHKFGERGISQNILKKVDLNFVSNKDCELALKKTRLGKYFELHKTFACAGGKAGKDTCGGDGGSPLVCKKQHSADSSYYQAGIVAWGIGCGEKGVPGVYADVRQAVDWITTKAAAHKI